MAKTLRDCLLEGGIKEKKFEHKGVGPADISFTYTVRDITSNDEHIFLEVDMQNRVDPSKAFTNIVYLTQENLYDQLVK